MDGVLKMKRRKIIFIILAFLFVLFVLVVLYNNTNIKITNINYINDKIPNNFNDFNIVQISDLHNEEFSDNNKDLIKEIGLLEPEIIAITGDLIDSKKYNLDIISELIKNIKDIAPIYFVSGNHEAWSNYNSLKELLIEENVIILENEMDIIKIDDELIEIHGIEDPAFYTGDSEDVIKSNLEYYQENDNFKILLSHRPELFEVYVEYDFDLVLSGHAHGGQVRIPFIGGLVAPDQGLLPKYDAGLFEKDNTTMYVSRGLGNSVIPLRVNNNPEIVNIILKK